MEERLLLVHKIYQNWIESDKSDIIKLELSLKDWEKSISNILADLKNMPLQEKRIIAPKINEIKNQVYSDYNNKKYIFTINNYQKYSDLSFSCKNFSSNFNMAGSISLLSQTILELHKIMKNLGFNFITSNHIESENINFDSLNIPKDHPSRTDHDTFFIQDKVLRTHTTTTEVHVLNTYQVPINMYTIGKVFRNDQDQTHSPMFQQLEGFCSQEDANISTMLYTLNEIISQFFGYEILTRVRPSFFPFTTPSFEIDIAYYEGKPANKDSSTANIKWLEIGGCGILHHNVLKSCNLQYRQIFAFGIGVERLCMLKYKVKDLRVFFDNRIDVIKDINIPVSNYLLRMGEN